MRFALFLSALIVGSWPMVGATAELSASTTIARADKQFIIDFMRGDAHGMASPYENDAIFIGPVKKIVRGRAAIEAMMRASVAKEKLLGGVCAADSIEVIGDQAWESGHCSYTVRIGGKTTSSGGRYFTLWERGADRIWRIAVNVAA